MGIVGITVGTAAGRRLALVVALACAFTVLGLQVVPPAGTPTEMWATHAAAFLWTSVVWDGRSRPEPAVAGHLAAQLAPDVLDGLLHRRQLGLEPGEDRRDGHD